MILIGRAKQRCPPRSAPGHRRVGQDRRPCLVLGSEQEPQLCRFRSGLGCASVLSASLFLNVPSRLLHLFLFTVRRAPGGAGEEGVASGRPGERVRRPLPVPPRAEGCCRERQAGGRGKGGEAAAGDRARGRARRARGERERERLYDCFEALLKREYVVGHCGGDDGARNGCGQEIEGFAISVRPMYA